MLVPARRWPRWAWFVVAGVVVAAGLLIWRLSARPARGAPTAGRFTTAEATRGPVQARVTANGTLSALVTVQVGSQVSGRVMELFVDFNSPVKKGELLARLDPKLFRASVEQARANHAAARGNVTKAQVQLEDAKRQLARVTTLFERKLIAQAELDAATSAERIAKAQVEVAQGALEQTRAALLQAETNLAYTEISSPIDGQVISRAVDVGQTVAASLQAPTLFVIAEDLRKMQVNTSISEADVGKVQKGMAARFTVDAFPADVFEGAIRQVRNAPQTIQNVVTYDAVIDVDNPELKLRPGMTATVTIVHAERANVLRVPNAALRFRPPPDLLERGMPNAQSGHRTLWVLRGPAPRPVQVKVGVTDGSFTEVLEGELKPGDALVLEATSERRTGPGTFGRPF